MLTLGTIKMWDERTSFGQHMLASEFVRVGKHLANDPLYESEFPTAFCLCHSLELLLKSFLQAKGRTPGSLKHQALRHNLAALLHEALREGLQISAEDKAVIEAVAPPARDFVFRYGAAGQVIGPAGTPATTHVDFPHPVLLADVSERLSQATWPVVKTTKP